MSERNILDLLKSLLTPGRLAIGVAALIIVAAGPALAVDPNGLVAHWSLDNTAADSGPNSLDGTPLNGIVYGDGVLGNGLQLDGVDDYVNITDAGAFPSVIGGLSEGTISVWFKFDRLPTSKWEMFPIFYMGDGVGGMGQTSAVIEIGHPTDGDTQLYWTTYRDDLQNEPTMCFDTNFNLSPGQWYNFMVVVDPSGNTGYLNGQELVDRDYNFDGPSSPEFLEDITDQQVTWLGRGYLTFSPVDQYFPGQIDEVLIYDRPLNATEVADYYQSVPEPATLSLLAVGASALFSRRRK